MKGGIVSEKTKRNAVCPLTGSGGFIALETLEAGVAGCAWGREREGKKFDEVSGRQLLKRHILEWAQV